MGIERIHVSVVDKMRTFAEQPFNVVLVLGTTTDPEAVKDVLKTFTADNLDAVALDFPVATPEYKTVAKMLAQDPHPDLFYVYSVTRGPTPAATDLSAALLAAKAAIEHDGLTPFYFVVLTEHEEITGDLEEVMDTAAANEWFVVAASPEGLTATQIRTLCNDLNSDRVLIVAHDASDTERPDAALAGYWAGMEVGSLTLDCKPLNNVSAAAFTGAQVATMLAGCPGVPAPIVYIKQAGVPVTVGSWSTNGTYADMRRAKDWLKARMTEAILGLKLQNPKIPQTDHGQNMVCHCIEGVLNKATSQGIVQPRGGSGQWEVVIPTLEWLARNDPQALAKRHLRTIYVRLWPKGAWEEFTIVVELSWSLD